MKAVRIIVLSDDTIAIERQAVLRALARRGWITCDVTDVLGGCTRNGREVQTRLFPGHAAPETDAATDFLLKHFRGERRVIGLGPLTPRQRRQVQPLDHVLSLLPDAAEMGDLPVAHSSRIIAVIYQLMDQLYKKRAQR